MPIYSKFATDTKTTVNKSELHLIPGMELEIKEFPDSSPITERIEYDVLITLNVPRPYIVNTSVDEFSAGLFGIRLFDEGTDHTYESWIGEIGYTDAVTPFSCRLPITITGHYRWTRNKPLKVSAMWRLLGGDKLVVDSYLSLTAVVIRANKSRDGYEDPRKELPVITPPPNLVSNKPKIKFEAYNAAAGVIAVGTGSTDLFDPGMTGRALSQPANFHVNPPGAVVGDNLRVDVANGAICVATITEGDFVFTNAHAHIFPEDNPGNAGDLVSLIEAVILPDGRSVKFEIRRKGNESKIVKVSFEAHFAKVLR